MSFCSIVLFTCNIGVATYFLALLAPQGVPRKRRTDGTGVHNFSSPRTTPFSCGDCGGYGFYNKVRPHGQSAAVGARSCISTASWLACALCIVALALLTVTMNSTSGSSSIFKDGRLKPGVYKIQNIQSETYLDIEVPSREVCCRPAKVLGEGRGIVSRHLCLWFVADNLKSGK